MLKPKILNYSDKKILLFLEDDLYPKDSSIESLYTIIKEFNIFDSIIALPDLHFKVKNFIPSGIVIPLFNEFSYKLLGPNNDGIGSLKLRISRKLKIDEIIELFQEIKNNIILFRRKEGVINKILAREILKNGIKYIIEDFGFSKEELYNFEEHGGYLLEDENKLNEIISLSLNKKPRLLPDFVPNTDIMDRSQKTLGVLDGTSHFIELYKIGKIFDYNYIKRINIKENDLFFIVHAGGGDISIILHRLFLEISNVYKLSTDLGRLAFEALKIAANYAFANRLFIYKEIRKILSKLVNDFELNILFDAPHDFIDVKDNSTFYHRKGAVKLIPQKEWGKGNFGKTYIFPTYPGGKAYLIWKKNSNNLSNNYVSHGAGRKIRKDEAISNYTSESAESLIKEKLLLFRYGFDSIEGQHPLAFKDEEKVLGIFNSYDLADVAAELVPIASLKT